MKIPPFEAKLLHGERRTDRQTGGQTDIHDEASSLLLLHLHNLFFIFLFFIFVLFFLLYCSP